MMRAIAPVGPRVARLGVYAVAIALSGVIAAIAGYAALRRRSASGAAPSVASPPPAPMPVVGVGPPAPPGLALRRRPLRPPLPGRSAPPLAPVGAPPLASGLSGTTAPRVPRPSAPLVPMSTAAPPGPIAVADPAAAAAPPPAAAPPGAGMPESLGEETAPPTEAELRAERVATVYAESIRFVVQAHRVQVGECYERAFKDDPAPRGGQVEVGFTIGAAGRARDAHVLGDSTGKPALGTCLAHRLMDWTFPRPPTGDFPTSYPFVFSQGTR
jgi:hypothetical protein